MVVVIPVKHQLAASRIFSPPLASVNMQPRNPSNPSKGIAMHTSRCQPSRPATIKALTSDSPPATTFIATKQSCNLNPTRRTLLLASGGLSLGSLLSLNHQHTQAQAIQAHNAPTQLRVLCTGPAGSIPDLIARRFGEQLSSQYPHGVLVDNKPGAAGQIAVAALKAAPADGSTMLLAQGALATIYPYLYNKLAYDPERDLQPVSVAGEMALALAVGPAVPASVTRISELITWLRGNLKLANGGSPGQGTLPHLLQAMLFRQSEVNWQHVIYPGGPQAIIDLIGGQIATLALPEGLLRQHKESGKIRILATSGPRRSAILPEVPSFTELGFQGLEMREWFGFFMPDKTPPALQASASRQIELAAHRAQLISAFSEAAITPVACTPAALSARIAAEQKLWQASLLATGIRAS
jgi:tripartite-type tricarboxylate transporter receptor subunit TctC